jgi:D-hexose-6-phosphate mutarotase
MNVAAGKMSIFDDSVTLVAGDDSVQVSAYGAHILSWKVDSIERLWLSSLSATDMSAPVCAALNHDSNVQL